MASRQWLKDNPKVLGYVPQPIHQQLQRFTVEHDVSFSKALTLILETYFELAPEVLPAPAQSHDAKLLSLEQEVKALRTQVDALHHSSKQAEATASLQERDSMQRDEPRRSLNTKNCKISRPGVEALSQMTTTEEPQKQNHMVDRSSQKTQAAPDTQEEKIPLYQTTSMSKRGRKLGKSESAPHSSERTILSSQKQIEAPDPAINASASAVKRLPEKQGWFSRLRLSGASQPTLSSPSDP